MEKTWLVLDCNYLCHRAFYSTGQLAEGVSFGFLRDVRLLMSTHQTEHIAFCFDHGPGLREKSYPFYKANRRKQRTEEEQQAREELRRQIKILRREYLPALGYCNIFAQWGYEADDLIASITRGMYYKNKAIIVSGDSDLYQLLDGERVIIWKPQQKRTYTEYSLGKDFDGITPSQWCQVKSIAGCSTDNIPGVPGVGEITAARFLRGKLKVDGRAYQSIARILNMCQMNLPLIRLPYPGLEKIRLKEDRVTSGKWRNLLVKLGMRSLLR